MKISQQPTGHILVKANTNSEWDDCDFAIIDCGGDWAEKMKKRLTDVRGYKDDLDFLSSRYYDTAASFYVSDEDESDDILPEGRNWAFVDLEEGEENNFKEPENRLSGYSLVLFKSCWGIYKVNGKHTGEEFFTEELPLEEILESISNQANS
jgi:hypothetical protein